MAVAALALDGLDDDRGDLVRVRVERRLDRLERAGLGGAVLLGVRGEGEMARGERRDGPVERGDVELVDRLARVAERAPMLRPWKLPSKESTLKAFTPGCRLSMAAARSPSLGCAPPRAPREPDERRLERVLHRPPRRS